MKIFIPERARGGMGGGWTFTRNIMEALKGQVEFVESLKDCDIYFITGPTLALKEEVEEAKALGKKIVLRVDNAPRNSRNRNTGVSRLLKYSEMADIIIYQSKWARDFLKPFLKKDGVVILNGVDTSIFKPEVLKVPQQGKVQYLYVRSSRDEIKRWETAWYQFQQWFFENPKIHLWIVGKFSDQNEEYSFDFFGGAEKAYTYLGVLYNQHKVAEIMRSADFLLCPFSFEACSNTVAEAMACGLKIIYDTRDGGGIPEQVEAGVISLETMANNYLEVFKKL